MPPSCGSVMVGGLRDCTIGEIQLCEDFVRSAVVGPPGSGMATESSGDVTIRNGSRASWIVRPASLIGLFIAALAIAVAASRNPTFIPLYRPSTSPSAAPCTCKVPGFAFALLCDVVVVSRGRCVA